MSNTTRIAKNTVFLYFRQILIMLVSLYTVRVVLNVLGTEDYGIYNVVAGVVVMFSFVNNAMASGTQRFLNFYWGKKDNQKTQEIFSASLGIHFFAAIIFVIVAETLGLWFVNSKLNIPSTRHDAALIVYQFSVTATVFNILKVPYNAVIIAYEKMSFFAGISIVEAILKLAIVFLLNATGFDKLIFYSVLITVVAIIILVIYKIYCNKKFGTAHFIKVKDKSLVKELLSFSMWSLFGATANIANSQGTNIVLNMFTNVTVNAAMGIATQVNAAVYSFVSNFQIAFNPQIIKSWAEGEREYFYLLLVRTAKFSFYLLFLLVLPLYVNTEFVLTIWLKNLPEYSVHFVRLILIWSLVESLNGPLYMAIQASGKIKFYQISIGIINFVNLPFVIVAFYFNANPCWVLYIRILLNVFALIFRIGLCSKLLKLSIKKFFVEVIFKVSIVVLISSFLTYFSGLKLSGLTSFFVTCFVSFLVSSLLVLFFGLSKDERNSIRVKVKRLMRQ